MKSYIRHLFFLVLWIGVIFVSPHDRLVDRSHDRDPQIYIGMIQNSIVYIYNLSYPDISHYIPPFIKDTPISDEVITPIQTQPSTGFEIYDDTITGTMSDSGTNQIIPIQPNTPKKSEPIQKHTIVNVNTTNLVSQIDHDLLAYISRQDMTGMTHYLSTVSDHTTFSRLLSKRYIWYTKGRDLPVSYRPGLVALSTYEQGYSKQARELAYIIIKHDPGYILPHQIIAYTSIADASYIQARKSLLTLIALDTTYTDTYRLLLGKVSYTMGEYTDAIIYLKQIQDGSTSQDRDEYIRKAYIALGDTKNITTTGTTSL